ncbi:hypothetical protein C7999DRAFT_37810 [Corynascus novoguineensis]|uniref:Heterokaryon incompatibility domain-containing protein n=1 Tax=Corynascus novoguineensis TaxID=1126955 RepID=A0AAN7D264_9PEZI|nr:hypothetical protein C7999DRAFT_37810 [Corynascus novoguineensis]
MPHRDESAPIQCQLFDYTLLDSGKGTHLYEALSYVWGSEEKPHSISTDKGDLLVTINLYMALKRLRDHSLDRIIWVDAICINQSDTEERNSQVQSMAKIFAKASRVVSLTRSVQVLQEVAAARQVLIMCHSTEIDGSTFRSGLNMLNPLSLDPDNQSRFHSIAYLINGANLRPKYATSRAGRFSLNIRPLGELMDMYHNRKATNPRDKIYALLELFHRLVKSLLSEQASVETWEEKEIAAIQTKGWVLGCVCKVEAHREWVGSQVVEVILKNVPGHLDKWMDTRWILQASAKPIQDASSPGGTKLMVLLLDRGGTEVKITEEVVKLAAENPKRGKEIMALLLDRRGTEVKITEEVVKAVAGNKRFEDMMALLLDRRGTEVKITEEVSWFRIARLFDAARTGDADAVRQLVDKGTPPDLQNYYGVTPLGIASAGGHEAVVQVLLATDSVDVNVRSADGQIPLFWAAANGHSKVVKLLLDHGAEQNCTDKKGRSPVSIAQSWYQADVIRIFTEHDTL